MAKLTTIAGLMICLGIAQGLAQEADNSQAIYSPTIQEHCSGKEARETRIIAVSFGVLFLAMLLGKPLYARFRGPRVSKTTNEDGYVAITTTKRCPKCGAFTFRQTAYSESAGPPMRFYCNKCEHMEE